MSENVRVTKAAGVVGSATLLSRILGLLRDMVLAGFFGAGLASDAFFVAFRIPNLLRRLFAEGSMSIAFVPIFTDYMAHKGKEEAFAFARSAFRVLSFVLVFVTLTGILLSPFIIKLIAWGYTDSPEKIELTIFLTRIMFPYIFLISLVALSMGILNVLGHFAAPALAPVLLNIAMIGSVFLLSPYFKNPVTGLAVGVVIGGVLQLALQIPFLMKNGIYLWEHTKFFHEGIKKVALMMVPAVYGAAVYQINILVVCTFLASLLAEGSVSYLYYADRLVQFPLGVFAISINTAVLPSLSRQAAANNIEAMKHTFGYALRLILFITVPSMIGLIILRKPIISILFERFAFDAETTKQTASALIFYAVGLWSVSSVGVLVATFYSLKDTKTPVKMATISVLSSIVFGVILMRPLNHGGLALAISLSSMLQFFLLIGALRKKLGSLGLKKIVSSVLKTIFNSLLMGTGVFLVVPYLIQTADGNLFTRVTGLAACIVIGVVIYGAFALMLKSRELQAVLDIIGRK
ncbi:MAG: murein biosynthesis integral membrane protein MurJ [Desulfobacterales bacterium]|nr:murein biosynthesis integral membrane protein MurJ [Desulfobacterales bacterium]